MNLILYSVCNREGDFPLEARLHLAAWIEEKFGPAAAAFREDEAAALAAELVAQLEARAAAMPDEPDKYLMRVQLRDIAENLKVREITWLFAMNVSF